MGFTFVTTGVADINNRIEPWAPCPGGASGLIVLHCLVDVEEEPGFLNRDLFLKFAVVSPVNTLKPKSFFKIFEQLSVRAAMVGVSPRLYQPASSYKDRVFV